MDEENSEAESRMIAHLTMLQGVISRMGANSFTLKALSATFASAAIAVMATAQEPSPYYSAAAIIPIVIFWLMDAQYLRYERGYRELFDRVRRGEDVDAYSLDAGDGLKMRIVATPGLMVREENPKAPIESGVAPFVGTCKPLWETE